VQLVNEIRKLYSGDVLAATRLPANGAQATSGWDSIPNDVEHDATVYVAYTPGVSGGSCSVQVEFQAYKKDEDGLVVPMGTWVSSGTSTITRTQAAILIQSLAHADTTEHVFEFTMRIPDGARQFRLLVAEVGQTGTPGSVRAWASAYQR
jgi:hypothetical protein